MDNNKYPMFIRWSDEDEAYIVTVPDLPGCMADGPTIEEAIANAQEVISLWIKTATRLGRMEDNG